MTRRKAGVFDDPDFERVAAANVRENARELKRLRKDFEREQFGHSACLTIAEGGHGWEKKTWVESPAVKAVRKLRADRDRLHGHLELVRAVLEEGKHGKNQRALDMALRRVNSALAGRPVFKQPRGRR